VSQCHSFLLEDSLEKFRVISTTSSLDSQKVDTWVKVVNRLLLYTTIYSQAS